MRPRSRCCCGTRWPRCADNLPETLQASVLMQPLLNDGDWQTLCQLHVSAARTHAHTLTHSRKNKQRRLSSRAGCHTNARCVGGAEFSSTTGSKSQQKFRMKGCSWRTHLPRRRKDVYSTCSYCPLCSPYQTSCPSLGQLPWPKSPSGQSRMSLKRIQALIFSKVEWVQKTAHILICCLFICLQRRQMPRQYCCVRSLVNCNRSNRAVLYAGKWFLFISVIPLK